MDLKKIANKYKAGKKIFFPNLANRMRLHYAENYESKTINPDMIVYETRDGKSIVDSPYAIFLYLASRDEYSNYKHVWIVDNANDEIIVTMPKKLREKVVFVYRNTLEYVDALLEGKYLISNSTFESFFVKRPNQVYINTWHGTPLKFMGFDIPGKVSHSQNVLRNFLMTDYILSPNAHTSNIFINSYKLHDIYPGKILESGYPRIDLTINSDKLQIIEKIRMYNTKIDENKPIILFSPTWKGSSVHDAKNDIEQTVNEMLALVKEFSDKYNVLIKVHPFIFSTVREDERISEYLISDFVDANEVLSVVDILVTDYSSIFFDFLVTNKPIIFYAWDKDLYDYERGMYLDEQELPGPTAENINELIYFINNVDFYSNSYRTKYEKLASKMTPYDDGKATERYVDYIFNNKRDSNITVKSVESDKKKILIFPGGMRNNGITSSLLNLVNNIDYTLYDITIISNPDTSEEINENLKAINKNARVMFRFGIDILTRSEKETDRKFSNNGVPKDKRSEYPAKGYQREMRRLTAGLKFDVAIDFSGYSYFWGRHILATQAKKHIAFMHNDLKADSMREVNGKMPMYKDLHGLFSIYYQFDKLLSVSPMTRDVNLNKLEEYVSKNQMSFVLNSIDISKILTTDTQQNSDSEKLNVNKELIKFTSDRKVKCYKNISDIKQGKFFEIEVFEHDNLIQFASINIYGNDYLKISIDNIYKGWILNDRIESRKIEVKNIENYHGFATVTNNLDNPIWKEIKTNTSSDEIVTYAKYFKNRYLEIEKVAYTSNEKYYLVKYNKQVLGWMSPESLARFHKVHRLSPINQYFLNRMNVQEKNSPVVFTKKVEEVSKFVKIRNKELKQLWTTPKGTTNGREIVLSEEYLNLYFKVSEISYVGKEKYCKLLLSDNNFVGYINERDIEYISENIFNSQVLLEDADYLGLPKMDLSLQKVAEIDEGLINFVNMGRLSPEKNQLQLIEAFGKFNQNNPNSRLYILGMGPLKDDLIQAVKDLKLEGKVILLGHLKKPFEFMKKMSYFVLPSFYEGQPMVLLESLTLGMKILASNIPANINVLGADEKYGLLTEGTSMEDIYNGLVKIVDFTGEFDEFDYLEYNKKALDNFYNEIG